MRRVSLTFSHVALIALALTALSIATVVWLWELASEALARSAHQNAYAESFGDVQSAEIESATTSAAD
ncbi:MAG: hypothetical protein JO187_04190 [Acidobacteria bacterium]|nr:hypothetical protein [Acidobacteriota bacterium]